MCWMCYQCMRHDFRFGRAPSHCPLPPLQLLAIIHILHLHVIYHQYLTLMTAYIRCAVQVGFSTYFYCFFNHNVLSYPLKMLANIMFAVHAKEIMPFIVCFAGGIGCLFLLLSPTARNGPSQYFRQFHPLSRQIKQICDK